jgi:hypothetical protein
MQRAGVRDARDLLSKSTVARLKSTRHLRVSLCLLRGPSAARSAAIPVGLHFAIELVKVLETNGLHYLRVGGRGFGLGAEETRSEKNTRKWRRIPPVGCTLC